jgi:murein L,D-transpeptidase YcbB/YkuD
MRDDAVLRAAAVVPSFSDYVKNMGWMSPLYVSRRAALAKYLAAHGSDPAERTIRLNLDRARILPGPWTRHVVVDAASARLWYYQDGKQQGTMRVIVGTPETPTPMLAGMVRYATLNPYWNVPSDLVQNRIAPKMLKGASFKGLRYQALSGWTADAHILDPREIDWTAVAAGQQEVRVRQLPGGANAMGRVKFMFPNDQGIYLHDTPDKSLLKKQQRHFSNGCIRLEDAPRLGKWFFGKPLVASSKTPEQQRALPEPVPVYLTYLTVTPTDRDIGFLEDTYGRDQVQQRETTRP